MQRKVGQKVSGSVRVAEIPVAARDVKPPAPAPVARAPVVVKDEVRKPAASLPTFSPLIERNQGEPEHREFPRAQLTTRFEVWVDDAEGGRRFAASLASINVSVSGAFLESTFYLPMGTVLGVSFSLEPGASPVRARAEIVREEREDGPEGRSGFGIRFLDFSGQTEVALARLFVGARLRAFAEDYLHSQRARSLPNELERVVDVLSAWELLKATSTEADPWQAK
ncbi:PilZ domain-containing protein [Myxococcus sp. CA051A]|uniref:PilZ domain-containing protein n=1 Tax=Myxococcus llanfairpwllgwyngyllgogerychwyrndrobwllllantysiliogogogochensis TaxID=2590453 RepID=A0A540WJL2_9BACT|nr:MULTISPECIES: PilZ domain-containing protein [Myxococcus]NTX04057.1 PilZ domain-containing protein [Myxococcus sp. CA040A]NTX13331.1 PilZ domain-containing protein [Myxococcus sp. CA056]NTX36217.1 PilZ domain-containing protein [Myxococcus sp. CA033]NTX57867.1 PilZ domain-containing protein [Myxococcus sp. CA039A]NTX61791.1 PilZ domain-containing protein [Myxococcus sp. CA051A]